MEIKILPQTAGDAREVMEVYHKAWLSTYPDKEQGVTARDIEELFKEELSEERLEMLRERMKHISQNERHLVAKTGNKVVGVCMAIKHADRNQLYTLYVLPEYQGRGVGTMLWEKAKEFFDPKKDTVVQVVTYNHKAKAFYEQLGFTDTGIEVKDEYMKLKDGRYLIETEMLMKAER